MSVTVGFSQATTSLIVPAAGTTKPDGAAAAGDVDGSAAGLFAALLAMLAPGVRPIVEAATDAVDKLEAPATAIGTILPSSGQPEAVDTTETPDLAALETSADGKALLKDLADALKAAKAALDGGKPLEPTLEKKLKKAVDAIAAWFAGQPQLQPPTIESDAIGELAAASNILPAPPSGDLPDAPAPASVDGDTEGPAGVADTPSLASSDTDNSGTADNTVPVRAVPAQLAELGDLLKDFAAQVEETSPDLAGSLTRLADRIGTGDVSDDALAQLGLTRSPGSTSPELEQLVAVLTSAPAAKPIPRADAPIAAPVLDIPEVLAGDTRTGAAPGTRPEPKKPEPPRADTTSADAPAAADEKPHAESLARASDDVELDTAVKLEPKAKAEDKTVIDDRPAGIAAPTDAKRADTPVPLAPPAVAGPDAVAQAAQAVNAATAARAIHAAYAVPVQQLNIPQVAFEVARQFEAGNTRFQIRLDPPELGRIDVKLDLDKSGTVNARMFVERPETLDLMMRDQRALQQALQQAGLDASRTNLEFSLRQNPFAGGGGNMGQGAGSGGQPGFGPFGTPATDEVADLPSQTLYRGSASQSGVNLFV